MLLQSLGPMPPGLTIIGLALTGVAVAAYIVRASKLLPEASRPVLLRLALLAPLLAAGLLPKMHDRYFFLADALALVLAAVVRDRDTIQIAILVQAGSTGAVFAYVSGLALFAQFGAVAMIAATWLVVRPLLPSRAPTLTAEARAA